MDAAEVRALVGSWAHRHPLCVAWDETEGRLLDVYSGRRLGLPLGAISEGEERPNREAGGTYVVLRRDDGVQVVLSQPGVAWAPVTGHTGPLAGLPEVVCWRDFDRVVGQVAHRLEAHQGEPPTVDDVTAVMFGIAALDGARLIGFEVSAEERRLEALLATLESNFRG